MKLNWRKHGIGYLAIALVITMVGFAAFNSFGAKAETGTTETSTETVVVTRPFTEAIKEVKSSVVDVYKRQLQYCEDPAHPQTRLDRDFQGGMGVSLSLIHI